MFTFTVLLILIPLNYCKCFSLIHNTITSKEVGKIIKSYMKPLTERFPNHEVEVQIEFGGLHRYPQSIRQRQGVIYNNPENLRARPANETKTTPSKPRTTTAFATKPPPTKPSSSSSSSPPPPPTITNIEKLLTQQSKPTKQPIYKEDLDTALDDLLKKISKLTKESRTNSEVFMEDTTQVVISNPGPVNDNQSINRIIELIKKGVQFQRNVTKPDNDNLEWMEIKIPKY